MFKFELSQLVTIKATNDQGTVEGRVEYVDSPRSYYVCFINKQGSLVKEWFDEKYIETESEKVIGQ